MERTAQRGLPAQIAGFVRQNLEACKLLSTTSRVSPGRWTEAHSRRPDLQCSPGCRHRSSRRHARRSCDCRCQILSDIRPSLPVCPTACPQTPLSHGCIGQASEPTPADSATAGAGAASNSAIPGSVTAHGGVPPPPMPDSCNCSWLRHSSGNWPHFTGGGGGRPRAPITGSANHGSRSDRVCPEDGTPSMGNIHGGTEVFLGPRLRLATP